MRSLKFMASLKRIIAFAITAVCVAQPLTREAAQRRARELASLGKRLFFDASLSASGKQACATCHDPQFAYGPPNDLSVQPGGPDMRQPGRRAVPSLRYLQGIPQFTEHYFDNEISNDYGSDSGPTGGLTWDGRVDRTRDQARIPLLSPYEMANESPAKVVEKALRGGYASELKRVARGDIFATILEALEAFQQDEREFYPYSSKYDAWLRGKAELSDRERLGLKLFDDPEKGDCARCHPSERGANGTSPRFTDFAFVALGVPRNPRIAANQDANWFDLGLCGPERNDFLKRAEYCGKFRTPSLRNVATRHAFFHNGTYSTLRETVSFYVKRDTDSSMPRLDDLPQRYWANVETGHPFGKREQPALTSDEIDAIVEFLTTLSDGYR